MHEQYQFHGAQTEVNQELIPVAKRYLASEYQRPIPKQQHEIFAWLTHRLENKMILDSGCGTGMSTQLLAESYPDHLVIGIDKSIHRLAKHAHFKQTDTAIQVENMILLQADLIDMWRLFSNHALTFSKHFLFYPNPWPKAQHIKRRFYAHPIFPDCMRLSSELICRANWLLYLQEMQLVLTECYQASCHLTTLENKTPMTRFEAKYIDVCPRYELNACL